MYAILRDAGKTSSDSERLKSSTKNGASRSICSFSRLVGIGSNEHCLYGSARTAAITSLTSNVMKPESEQPGGADEKDGAGA